MGGTALDSKAFAYQAAEILASHNARDVLVMDIAETAGWADYFVVATTTSSVHMRGLERHLEEFLSDIDQPLLNRPEAADDQRWLLLDAGTVVIHLMTEEARAFYDLESLWYSAPRFAVSAPTT